MFHVEHTIAVDRLQTCFMLNTLLVYTGCRHISCCTYCCCRQAADIFHAEHTVAVDINHAEHTLAVDRLQTCFMLNILLR